MDVKNRSTKVKSVIRLIRPKTLFWFCIATCLGFASVIQHKIPDSRFFFLLLTIVFANIGAIIINDIGDIKVDSCSEEAGKRSRPLVTGAITIKEAIFLAAIFYSISLLISFFYDFRATIFSLIVILLSLSYSLPPTKFASRPYASILYWVVLCSVCYLLMLNALTTTEETFFHYLGYIPGWVFIVGIIFYMGIAEIMAKDLRDLVNDEEGGRNTFVNFVGVKFSSRFMLLFAWFGLILWIEALYLSVELRNNIPAIACIVIGLIWCTRITMIAFKLSSKFEQTLAANLHTHWTYSYAAMQILTFLSFL